MSTVFCKDCNNVELKYDIYGKYTWLTEFYKDGKSYWCPILKREVRADEFCIHSDPKQEVIQND